MRMKRHTINRFYPEKCPPELVEGSMPDAWHDARNGPLEHGTQSVPVGCSHAEHGNEPTGE